MKRRYLCASFLLVAACGSGGGGDNPDDIIDAGTPDAEPLPPSFAECDASDQSFVRQAHLALLGSRPKSQSQVSVYSDLMTEVRARAFAGEDVDPQQAVAEILVEDSEFIERWSEHFMDALRVPRVEDQSQQFCYGDSEREVDNGELAAYVRDNAPSSSGDGGTPFTMLDLLRSSLVLDDLSPVYRAHLFALVSKGIPAANVPRVQAELARREDFGNVFDATYLNRDMTCLACHNHESSVTEDVANPELSRHFDVPGYFEKAIYGDSYGIDPNVAHAPFRFDGFVSDNGHRPWGWDRFCGRFQDGGVGDDIADIDGVFASLSGKRLTVFDLEQALRSGFDSIAADGVVVGADETIANKDAAFAYLVASNIVDGVWAEVIGHPLTISNHFPRNAESRDLLRELTENFIKNNFSLKKLLVDIVSSDYFNRQAPAEGCGTGPYNMPPVFDPWTTNEEDAALKANGPGDGVKPLSARTLLRAAHSALQWRRPFFDSFPEFPSSTNQCAQVFPSCSQMANACESQGNCCFSFKYWCDYGPSENEPRTSDLRALQRGIGVFLKHGDKGFRGLDFQARLVFEDRFGTCRKIDPFDDFIDELIARAQTSPGATLEDVLIATKDRLIGEPRIHDSAGSSGTSERAALEQMFGSTLDTTVDQVGDLDGKLRSFCGALLSTPQFLLQGVAPADGEGEPKLTPSTFRYETVCANLQLGESLGDLDVVCSPNGLSLQ